MSLSDLSSGSPVVGNDAAVDDRAADDRAADADVAQADGSDSDASASTFCASLAPKPTFCADFDGVDDVASGWTRLETVREGSITLDSLVFRSGPASARVLMPGASTSTQVIDRLHYVDGRGERQGCCRVKVSIRS